jgi:transposase
LAKLGKDEVVTIHVLAEKGETASAIARRLAVTEGAVRYHLRRKAAGRPDGRAKPSLIERSGLVAVVEQWWRDQLAALPDGRSPNADALWELLKADHGYVGSPKSVRKYVRRHFARPPLRPFRRVETPPGAQTQTDWCEHRGVDIGDALGPVTLYAFAMVLSHSRRVAVIWCRSMDQLSWHRAHNEAFTRLGGVAAVNRIDNLKTGIASGAGAWGRINERYLRYAKALGFHVDACQPRSPEQKGKVERRCGVLRTLAVAGRCFASIEALQQWTDQKLDIADRRRICPATGTTVAEAWERERALLRPLPETLPEPFDLVRTAIVHRDCTVAFEGRRYTVPFAHVGLSVEVRGCAESVQIVDPVTGGVLRRYPRGTPERLLIDPTCYDGAATERVARPTPLGAMARRIDELKRDGVERRSVDFYAELAEVAR